MTDRIYKIGDRVRVIAGPRKGEVTTVESELTRILLHPRCVESSGRFGMLDGALGYVLAIPHEFAFCVYALPSWLEPCRDDDREPAEEVESWIADLCKRKERA